MSYILLLLLLVSLDIRLKFVRFTYKKKKPQKVPKKSSCTQNMFNFVPFAFIVVYLSVFFITIMQFELLLITIYV